MFYCHMVLWDEVRRQPVAVAVVLIKSNKWLRHSWLTTGTFLSAIIFGGIIVAWLVPYANASCPLCAMLQEWQTEAIVVKSLSWQCLWLPALTAANIRILLDLASTETSGIFVTVWCVWTSAVWISCMCVTHRCVLLSLLFRDRSVHLMPITLPSVNSNISLCVRRKVPEKTACPKQQIWDTS